MWSRRAMPLYLASVLLLAAPGLATTLSAQEPEATPAAAAKRAPIVLPAAEAKPVAVRPPARRGLLANVRVDVRITDTRGSQPPISKTVSITVADRRQGMVRSTVDLVIKGGGLRQMPLNVDAKPSIEEGKIRLELTVDYKTFLPETDAATTGTDIREYVELVLESGKPTTVSESADAYSDRSVKLEVTATIL